MEGLRSAFISTSIATAAAEAFSQAAFSAYYRVYCERELLSG
jgi:hypothetical protein